MCTVTIVPVSGGTDPHIRIACNRDESRARPIATSPVTRELRGTRAIMPIDPVSNGTWIGVNEIGIAAVLLNVNLGDGRSSRLSGNRMSRGEIVPGVLGAGSIADAWRSMLSIDARRYPPFRLIMLSTSTIAQAYSDGRSLCVLRRATSRLPMMFTSSGLGDSVVEPPRRALFGQMFARDGDVVGQQTSFHCHSWPNLRHLSVCMERPEARTVSHTVIDLRADSAELTYTPDAPDRAVPSTARSFALEAVPA